MQRTLQEHVTALEQKVALLKMQQTDLERTSGERYQAALDLEIAEKALAHFKRAYELEQKIAHLHQT